VIPQLPSKSVSACVAVQLDSSGCLFRNFVVAELFLAAFFLSPYVNWSTTVASLPDADSDAWAPRASSLLSW
jgi:hypothetical protein